MKKKIIIILVILIVLLLGLGTYGYILNIHKEDEGVSISDIVYNIDLDDDGICDLNCIDEVEEESDEEEFEDDEEEEDSEEEISTPVDKTYRCGRNYVNETYNNIPYQFYSYYEFFTLFNAEDTNQKVSGKVVYEFKLNNNDDYNNFDINHFNDNNKYELKKDENNLIYQLSSIVTLSGSQNKTYDINKSDFNVDEYLNIVKESGFNNCEELNLND